MEEKCKKTVNLRLSTTISIIVGVALIAIILLISIGYQKINVLKSNIDTMYISDIKKIELSRSISTQMDTIHADIKGQIIEYDQSLGVTIESNIGSLDASLRSFLEMLSNEGSSTDDINKLMLG